MLSSGRRGLNVPAIGICCAIEAELTALPPEEQKEFLESLGVAEAAFGRVIRAAFSLLGRISYFTVGEDEVKAWVIPAGTKAPRAAGVIHNDFERGFIKAEVIGYEEFIACGGTHAAAKAAGKLRLEGKEYVVRGRRHHQLPLQRLTAARLSDRLCMPSARVGERGEARMPAIRKNTRHCTKVQWTTGDRDVIWNRVKIINPIWKRQGERPWQRS